MAASRPGGEARPCCAAAGDANAAATASAAARPAMPFAIDFRSRLRVARLARRHHRTFRRPVHPGANRLDRADPRSFRPRPYNRSQIPTLFPCRNSPKSRRPAAASSPASSAAASATSWCASRAFAGRCPRDLAARLRGEQVLAIRRRGKYLLFDCRHGPPARPPRHVGQPHGRPAGPPAAPPRPRRPGPRRRHIVRLNDPRRFGAVLWVRDPAEATRCCAASASSPSTRRSTASPCTALARGAARRREAVPDGFARRHRRRQHLRERGALRRAHPSVARAPGASRASRCDRLAGAVRAHARRARSPPGGSTLRDFVGSRRHARAFPARVRGLRPRGRALPALRRAGPRARARPAARPSTARRASDERDRQRLDHRAIRAEPRRPQGVARGDGAALAEFRRWALVQPPRRRQRRGAPRAPRAAPRRRAAHHRLRRRDLARQERAHQRALLRRPRRAPAAVGRGAHDALPHRDPLRPVARRRRSALLPIETRESPSALREFIAEADALEGDRARPDAPREPRRGVRRAVASRRTSPRREAQNLGLAGRGGRASRSRAGATRS